MQEHAPQAQRGPRAAVEGKVAVFRISHDRVADGGEMAADLVGAPRFDAQLQKGGLVAAGDLRIVGDRLLQIHAPHLLARERLLVLGKADLDGAAFLLEASLGEGQVGLLRFTRGENLGEPDHRLAGLRDHHHAARLAIEAVRRARLEFAFRDLEALPREVGASLVNEGVAGDPGPRMDGKTRRLVADEKVGVLVEDSEVLAAGRQGAPARRAR